MDFICAGLLEARHILRIDAMFKRIFIIGLFCLFSGVTPAKSLSGVDFADSITLGDSTLQLNGVGARTKLFVKLYIAGLYLETPSSDAEKIMNDDSPMSLDLEIVSGLIDSKKMEEAVIEGFNHATNGNTAEIQTRIDTFLSVLREEIKKKDRFTFNYKPETGTHIVKNNEEKAVIEGLDFKSALFGIWISEKPAQKKLKRALLGQ